VAQFYTFFRFARPLLSANLMAGFSIAAQEKFDSTRATVLSD
jgi:hypothetical protein